MDGDGPCKHERDLGATGKDRISRTQVPNFLFQSDVHGGLIGGKRKRGGRGRKRDQGKVRRVEVEEVI